MVSKVTLSVSIVAYAPELTIVRDTLRSLAGALDHARARSNLGDTRIVLIDNGPGNRYTAVLAQVLREELPQVETELRSGHGNIGYGRGHNLALRDSGADYHLVLNPDVVLTPDAVDEALRYMAASPDVTILAPLARDAAGEPLYLCKRYPSVLDLLLRGFAPGAVKRAFRARLERYEMRDLPLDRPSIGIPIVSGSFMFCRRSAVVAIGGFSDEFFLYFEDFDLSLRAGAQGQLALVPTVRITHHGGNAARKGWQHVRLFVRSAITFFNRHGWKWA